MLQRECEDNERREIERRGGEIVRKAEDRQTHRQSVEKKEEGSKSDATK